MLVRAICAEGTLLTYIFYIFFPKKYPSKKKMIIIIILLIIIMKYEETFEYIRMNIPDFRERPKNTYIIYVQAMRR